MNKIKKLFELFNRFLLRRNDKHMYKYFAVENTSSVACYADRGGICKSNLKMIIYFKQLTQTASKNIMVSKKILLFIIFFFVTGFSIAQQNKNDVATDRYRAIHWTTENGLSNTGMNVMVKDIKGFLKNILLTKRKQVL